MTNDLTIALPTNMVFRDALGMNSIGINYMPIRRMMKQL